jgi:hypothetical protein
MPLLLSKVNCQPWSRQTAFALLVGIGACIVVLATPVLGTAAPAAPRLGEEKGLPSHLQDDDEQRLSLQDLLAHGLSVFTANWTPQDGGGRPLTKGNGRALADPRSPLVGSRAFNRVSGPDANSCAGCHNAPYGVAGGSGDFVTNVFVLGQRFDFATFDHLDKVPTRGALGENGEHVTLQTVGNSRHTPGMFGAGYIEMLAREMTEDLQKTRDSIRRGESRLLSSKGVSFGKLTRRADGLWDASEVSGLSRLSLITATPLDPPSLIIRPWHQAGNAISLREFTNTSFNHHHGIQTIERFGAETDPDGDGVKDELSRADVTAVTVFQAAMAVPGRVIPTNPILEKAIRDGETLFHRMACVGCHVPAMPLSRKGWFYSEPNPFNAPGNLRNGDAASYGFHLSDPSLPQPRLQPDHPADLVMLVPAYTDMKLHDISDPQDDAQPESLDMNWPAWAPKFSTGNRRFLTRRLWGVGNSGPYFHHGLFTTMREAIGAHSGEALSSRKLFQAASTDEQNALIEFLKSLQVLPPGSASIIVDQRFQPRAWSPPVDGQ